MKAESLFGKVTWDVSDGKPLKRNPSARAIVGWSLGIALFLLLVWFVAAVVVPVWQVYAATERLAKGSTGRNREIERLGGPEAAVRKVLLYMRFGEHSLARRSALLTLLEYAFHRSAIPGLIQLAADEDKNIRAGAVELLSDEFAGDPRAFDVLAAALANKKDLLFTRSWAIIGLAELNDPRAVEVIIKALEDGDPEVRHQAALALGDIGDARAVGPLIAAIKDQKRDNDAAAGALAQIDDPRALEPLLAALRDENADVRGAAADALGRIEGRRAVEPLLVALKDTDEGVRAAAADSLGYLKDRRAVEPLAAALKDADEDVRARAAEALAKLGDRRAYEPLLAMLKDKDGRFRKTAARALGTLKDPRAVEPLIALLKGGNLELRHEAVDALGDIGDRRAIEPLKAQLKDKQVYCWVLRALAKILKIPEEDISED